MKRYHKKIVFLFRFFSGLQSVKKSTWKPKGVPAIYKLLEKVDKNSINARVIFLCKSAKESEGIDKIIQVSVKELPNIQFTIVPFRHYFSIPRINFILNSFLQFVFLFKYIQQVDPCLIYCDRANLAFGAFFAFWKKVVVRMLGVEKYVDFYKKRKNAILHPIRFFSLSAPFAYIICSKDGSPGEYVLQKYINKKTNYVTWLNGVDSIMDDKKKGVISERVILLFVGRLEYDKGIIELIEAAKKIRNYKKNNFEMHVVGEGSLGDIIKKRISSYSLEDCVFLHGEVSHGNIISWYIRADVYISLNKLGNLSNTVLEALNLGKCMILLKGDGVVDKDTDEILPEDVAFKVDRNNIVDDLAEKIKFILDNPDCIMEHADKTKKIAKALLVSWEDRINKEIDLLNNICY